MKVSELIAALQALPQDLPVYSVHSSNCCCGECLDPADEEWEVCSPYVGTVRGHGYKNPPIQAVIL